MNCRYGVAHALTAAAIMMAAISNNFWHNFLHGAFKSVPAARVIVLMVVAEAVLFGFLLLGLWLSVFISAMRDRARGRVPLVTGPLTPAPDAMGAGRGMLFAVKTAVPICIGALLLAAASEFIFGKVLGIDAAGQDLVKWLQPGTYPPAVRWLLIGFALLEAPVLEELLFRGVVFRGLAKAMPAWAAMAASGFVFALIHVNAATLLPLWFLGAAFAWLYWRTGSILAPITVHCLFNAANVGLVFLGVAQQ